MNPLIWSLLALSTALTTNVYGFESPDIDPKVKRAICQQVAKSIPQIDRMGISVEGCVGYAEFEVVTESASRAELNLIVDAGDEYIADCRIRYSKSSLKVRGNPICELYVP
jgi:hypothetical protein